MQCPVQYATQTVLDLLRALLDAYVMAEQLMGGCGTFLDSSALGLSHPRCFPSISHFQGTPHSIAQRHRVAQDVLPVSPLSPAVERG
jgi:hypothetical protein